MASLISAFCGRRVRLRRPRPAGPVSEAELRAAHDRLETELDALLAHGVLLDPVALSRLRAAIDEALPAAAAYERQLAEEPAA